MNEYLTGSGDFGYSRNRMPDPIIDNLPPYIDDDEIINAGPESRRQEQPRDGRGDIDDYESFAEDMSKGERIPAEILQDPEALKKWNEARSSRQTSSRAIIGEIERRLLAAKDDQVAKAQVRRLASYASALKKELEKGTDINKIKEAEQLVKDFETLEASNNRDEIKLGSKPLYEKLEEGLRPFEGKGNPSEYVHSLEELAEIIMDQSGDQWQPGGEFELIDNEGKFHPENFHAWIRERIWFYDDFNPDTDINLFSDIAIPTVFRNISFQEMYATDRYFRKRTSSATGDVHSNTDETYDDLKNQLLYEVWLHQQNHNNDTQYRLVSGNADEQKKAMSQMHYHNIFTRNRDRLLRTLRLPSIDELENNLETSVSNKVQGRVGKGHQRTLLAYMYLPDREMFQKVFTKEGNKTALDAFYKTIVEGVFKEKVMAVKHAKWKNTPHPDIQPPGRTEPTEKEIEKTEVDIFGVDKKEK